MATTEQPVEIDEQKLGAFMNQAVGELGATLGAALVVIGDKLGLYKAMAGAGPLTSNQLAERTGTAERYVREWLNAQAAGGYVTYDPATRSYTLPAEQAVALADESSPFFLCGAFQGFASLVRDEPRIREAFTSGAGVGWHEHHHDLFEGTERFFRSGYNAHLVAEWIPALDGVEARLRTGIRVADVGCGLGASTIIMAKAFPASQFIGFDYHPESIEAARGRAAEAGVSDRVRFEVAPASGFTGAYDFVTMFDCLHDMGDPVGAARHVLSSLEDDGTWLIVEPFAGDKVEDNLNPVGRVYYGASTLVCTPRFAVAGSRPRARRPGWRGASARRRHGRRLYALPPRNRDALQHRARGSSVSTTIAADMSRRSATRARDPDLVGFAAHGGVRVAYESFGSGDDTILCLPSWTLVQQRQWKAQVPYLARHCRVVTFDPRGNGGSDRPAEIAAYSEPGVTGDALAVLDALGIERAALLSLSGGAIPALMLAADHPQRVSAAVFIGASVPLADGPEQDADFDAEMPEYEGWARYNRHFWLRDYGGFCEWFFGEIFPEPHSTRQIESGIEWSQGTTADILIKTVDALVFDRARTREVARRVRCPVLVIHGDDDRVQTVAQGAALAAETGGRLVMLEGSGHSPNARDPVRVNLLLREFLLSPSPPAVWRRAAARAQRALFISSPIGLGHARRDLAIARELRRLRPGLEIEWLAQSPATALFEAAGERIHPASAELAGECAHIESEAGEHCLPVFDALRRMDEILVANFMLFHDVARDGCYDLWLGDEAWDVDYYLHENPELKSAPYAWLSDFVGYLPLPEGGEREAFLTADYNAEMLEQIARYPHVRDRAIFVGDPDDIVGGSFGPGLPEIRPWVEQHYEFSGQITGFDPPSAVERAALRRELGWAEDEQICLVAVGGSGVGSHLLEAVVAAQPAVRRLVPGLRMVAVCGPRIDPAALEGRGVELHGYVDGLHRWLGGCDIGVVQGGLTTTMELVAARRPFLYFPLERHFEQRLHVAHRLARHRAGRRMEYATATAEGIAEAIAQELRRPVTSTAVASGGAARAASLIAPLLSEPYPAGR